MGRGPAHFQKGRFNLGREYIDAADDQHVIRPSRKPCNPGSGPAALTDFVVDAGQILGAVTDKRQPLLGQCGDDQFALHAVPQRFQGLLVHDFRQEMVLMDMKSPVELTVRCHTRSHDFTQAIDIVGMDSQLMLNLGPHPVRPGLSPVDGRLQLNLVPNAHLFNGFRDVQQIGRGAHDARHAEIHHHGHQLLGVSRGHGHNRGPHFLGAVMRAQAAGEQAVTICHLYGILLAQARHGDASCHALAPHINILPRISHHSCLSRGAAGCVDTGNLGIIHCKHAEWIGIPQIILGGERQLIQVLNPLDIAWLQSLCLHFLPVILHVVVHTVHQF